MLWLVALLVTLTGNAFAQMFVDWATVSPTAPLQSNRLCYSDGRDIACDNAAGLLITSGTFQIPTLYATTVSATGSTGTVSATYGYFKYISASFGMTGGTGASRLASLTDVTTTGVVSGSVLAYNAATTSWTALPLQNVMSTTTIATGIPDAIMCNISTPALGNTVLTLGQYSGTYAYYTYSFGGTTYYVLFNGSGNFSSYQNITTSNCNTSLSSLYASGQAFNFIGSNLSSAASPNNSLQWSNNGNQAGDANLQWLSSTAIVSVTGTVSATNIYAKNISASSLYVGGVAITGSGGSGDRAVSITTSSASIVAYGATGTVSISTGGVSGTSYFNTTGQWIGPGISTTGYVSSTGFYNTGNARSTTISASTAIQVGSNALTCATGISGTMRYSSISSTMEYCNGTAWTSMGPSSTQPVSFLATNTGTQTVTAAAWNKVTLGSKTFDTNNNFDTSTSRFTATVPGKYLFTGSVYCSGNSYCYVSIYKNGSLITQNGGSTAISNAIIPTSIILDMAVNDYVELYVYPGATTVPQQSYATSLAGALLSPQGNGGSADNLGNHTATQDLNMAGFNVNNAAIVSSVQVSATNVSATLLQLGTTATCNASTLGMVRRNPVTNKMQVCQ